MLYFIGIGLSIKHLTLEAIDAVRRVDKIYVDTYTSIVPDLDINEFRRITGFNGEIIYAKRNMLEGEGIEKIVLEAMDKDIAILVPGDPFIATTHDAIRVEALKRGVRVVTINGLSIYSLAPSRTGLQAYRFGKTATLVYPEAFKPYYTIETIYDNLERNLHSLILLDLRIDENKAMRISEAVDILQDLDDKGLLGKVLAVGIARLGSSDEFIIADRLVDLKKYDYPPPPHSIIIVAKPHPIELENLYYLCRLPRKLYEKYLNTKNYP
jgi:diphthine synthase